MARKPNKAQIEKRIEAMKAKLAAEEASLKAIADEEASKSAVDPQRVIALRAAAMAAIHALQSEDRDALPTVLVDLLVSSWPRERTLMRRFNLSETETQAAAKVGKEAIGRLRWDTSKL